MFKKIKEFKKVSSYKISLGSVIYKDDKSLFDRSLYQNELLLTDKGITGFQLIGNMLLFSNWKNETYKRDLITGETIKLNYEQVSENKIDNNLVFRIGDIYLIKARTIDEPVKISNDIKFYINYLHNNLYYSTDKKNTSIYSYTFPDVKLKWQFDLSLLGDYKPQRKDSFQKYEVIKFLGVWQDELLVACSNGLILCLDINNGEETRRFHKCPSYILGSITYDHFDSANSFVFDQTEELIFSLYAYYYMEINLQTGEITIIDLRTDMAKNQISLYRRSSGYAWDENHIYTIGEVANHVGEKALGDRCLLAFNRGTKEIDWQYIFENDSVNTDIPQLDANRLYQLTANNVLHIFQKEEKAS